MADRAPDTRESIIEDAASKVTPYDIIHRRAKVAVSFQEAVFVDGKERVEVGVEDLPQGSFSGITGFVLGSGGARRRRVQTCRVFYHRVVIPGNLLCLYRVL